MYVDDILLASNCEEKMREVERELLREYELSSMGETNQFLGMEVERDVEKGIVKITQKQCAMKILRKFNFDKASLHVNTPMATNDQRSKREVKSYEQKLKVKSFPFCQIIGLLLYLQGGTRPDLTYAVNVLSRKQSNFDEFDCIEVKRVLRYLKTTIDLGLEYRSSGEKLGSEVICYVDASLGMNDEEGHSTTGYAIYMYGDLICWRTKRQNHVALSSAEAEYVAMSLACRDVISIVEMMRRILREKYIPVICEDSRPAINLAETEESKTLKHIVKLCYHYVRELARDKKIKIEWVNTKKQIGDFFTKPLPPDKFRYFRDMLIKNC